ncbi:MAG: hypothetical protein R3A52_24405 [Polyangiales bacterium]
MAPLMTIHQGTGSHVALGNTVGHCLKARLVVATVLRDAPRRRQMIVKEEQVRRARS